MEPDTTRRGISVRLRVCAAPATNGVFIATISYPPRPTFGIVTPIVFNLIIGNLARKDTVVIDCTFELNDKPMSAVKYGGMTFPAFSGYGDYVNRKMSACIAGFGSIPPGSYYITDRQSGGILGSIRDTIKHRREWFSLVADDGKIDDETICDKVIRGQFRLHPKGALGISQGCIVINDLHHFHVLRGLLKGATQEKIPGTSVMTYGRMVVA